MNSLGKLCFFTKVVIAIAISFLSVTEYKICYKSWVFLTSKNDCSTSIFAIAVKN
jgi:hypothetical protein